MNSGKMIPRSKRLQNIWMNVDGALLNNLTNPNIPWPMKAIMVGRFMVRRRYFNKIHSLKRSRFLRPLRNIGGWLGK